MSNILESKDLEKPSNFMKKWKNEEIIQLLGEISDDIDIEKIANIHQRTTGGIRSRLREIAFEFYNNNIPMNEIIEKTKLTEKEIFETISKREKLKTKKEEKIDKNYIKMKNIENGICLEHIINEVNNLKNEINVIKNDIHEILNILKNVEFV